MTKVPEGDAASSLERLLREVRACDICAESLPQGPRPVLQAGEAMEAARERLARRASSVRWGVGWLALIALTGALAACSNHNGSPGSANGAHDLLIEFTRDDGPNIGGYGLLAKLTTSRSERGARWTVRIFVDGRVETRVCLGPRWKRLRGRLSVEEVSWLREQRDALSRLNPREVVEGLWSDHHAYNEMVLVSGRQRVEYQAVTEPDGRGPGPEILASVASLLEERFSLARIGDC